MSHLVKLIYAANALIGGEVFNTNCAHVSVVSVSKSVTSRHFLSNPNLIR